MVATSREVVHWTWQAGYIRLALAITDELVASWGVDSVPFLRDHGSSDGFGGRAPEIDDVLGRLRNLRVESEQLVADAVFDPDFEAYYQRVKRGTLTDASAGFEVMEAVLEEFDEDGDEYPLYRATEWRLREGSLVWTGADEDSKFRRQKMDPEQIAKMIEGAVTRAMSGQRDAAAAADGAGAGDAGGEAAGEADADTNAAEVDETAAAEAEADEQRAGGMGDDDMERAIKAGVAAAMAVHGKRGQIIPMQTRQPRSQSMDVAFAAAIRQGVPADVVQRAEQDSHGDVRAFNAMVRRHLQDQQAVPAVAPRRGSVTGGQDGVTRAMGDMVVVACARQVPTARTNPNDTSSPTYAQEAAKRGYRDVHGTSMLSMVETIARAHNPSLGVVTNPRMLIEHMMAERFVAPEHIVRDDAMGNGRFIRDAYGGLTPSDLQSVFLDITYKILMAGYMRYSLPWAQVARIQPVTDFRPVNLIWYDVAGQYEKLAQGENLRPLTLRDKSAQFQADNYGHVLKVEYHAIIDDDLGVITRLPQLLGEWCASQQTRVFALAVASGTPIGGSTVYAGDFDLAVADQFDYETNFETIRQRALAVVPVAAGANEDPRNTPGRTYSMQPDTLLYGLNHNKPLFDYMQPIQLIDSRTENRRAYEQQLYNNSHEVLDLPGNNAYLYPGPQSPHCPFTVGWVRGEQMRTTMMETGGHEQDGLLFRCTSTFGAGTTNNNAAYRIRPNS